MTWLASNSQWDNASASRTASFRSTGATAICVLANNARSRLTISAARFTSRRVRRAVSGAPSRLGGSPLSMRRQVLALVMIPDRGWFTLMGDRRGQYAKAAGGVRLPALIECRLEPIDGKGPVDPTAASVRRVLASMHPQGGIGVVEPSGRCKRRLLPAGKSLDPAEDFLKTAGVINL